MVSAGVPSYPGRSPVVTPLPAVPDRFFDVRPLASDDPFAALPQRRAIALVVVVIALLARSGWLSFPLPLRTS